MALARSNAPGLTRLVISWMPQTPGSEGGKKGPPANLAYLQPPPESLSSCPTIYAILAGTLPQATQSLWKDLSDLLTFLKVKTALPFKALRTTNAIERCFRKVRRRT